MSFLIALGLIIGLVSGGIGIYEFTKNRKRPGTILTVTAIGIVLAAYIVANLPFSSAKYATGIPPAPTASNPQQETGVTPTPSPSPTPIPSPTPMPFPKPGTMLYQENGSDNWQGWSGDQAWKVLNHFLLNDGTSDDFSRINAPYQVAGTADYAVESRFQVVSYEHRVS
jgi:hypothetical protein